MEGCPTIPRLKLCFDIPICTFNSTPFFLYTEQHFDHWGKHVGGGPSPPENDAQHQQRGSAQAVVRDEDKHVDADGGLQQVRQPWGPGWNTERQRRPRPERGLQHSLRNNPQK